MAQIERRTGVLFLIFLLVLAVVGLRAMQLTVFQSASLKQQAEAQQKARVILPAPRGGIFDRNGGELAVSVDAADISANPRQIAQPNAVAAKLAPLLGFQQDALTAKLADRSTGFVYLKRDLPGGAATKIKRLKFGGIDVTPKTRRIYPSHSLAAQVLGFVGIDGNGLSGLEYAYDKKLHGVDGDRRIVKDASSEPIASVDVRKMRPGADLTLSIDGPLQLRTEAVLADLGAKFHPKGATALVMDPNSGDVLAMANWPKIDANMPSKAPAYAVQNRAIGSTYEPGSTFKAITVAGALQDGKVSPSTPFSLPPTIQVADRVIKESHERGAVNLTTSQILAQSSNIGAVKIGLLQGKQRFDQWVRRFGFGRPTGFDMTGEEQGIVPGYKQYSGSSMGNLPIGQGLSVTPLQMATAYSVIANGGILRPPRVVKSIGRKQLPLAQGQRVISTRTAARLRKMLEGVLAPGGTAQEAQIPGYSLAGKTGTAQKPDPLGGYSKTRYVGSFIGFAPAKNPRLLVAVMVDEPQGAIYGGVVAAPAFQQIVSFGLPYLRIPPR